MIGRHSSCSENKHSDAVHSWTRGLAGWTPY